MGTEAASRRAITVLREGFPEPPGMDTAVSRALLQRVARGEEPESLRLHRPGRVVAFGPLDRLAPGYAAAVAAARAGGFAPIERLAGGRAAVFHEGTIAFSWVVPNHSPRTGIRARFDLLSGIIVEGLRRLGVDARVGELPGEWCRGEHSVNAGGRVKIMGVGQRVVAGAAHVGGVIVVSGSDLVRDVLAPVYEALAVAWDPGTCGSIEDEVGPVPWDAAAEAILESFADRFELTAGSIGAETLELARSLVALHLPAVEASRGRAAS